MPKEKWVKYTGEYEKEFYDVRVGSAIYGPCWPNAGSFHVCKGIDEGRNINGNNVTWIRKAAHPFDEE